MYTALPDVFQTLRQTLFDEGFRGEDQAVAFQFNLQVIARRESQFIVKFLWNSDLPANPDLDDCGKPARLGLYFHIIIFNAVPRKSGESGVTA